MTHTTTAGAHATPTMAREDTGTTGINPAFTEAFRFVQRLAAELSGGRVELPAYPDVALRVREVLADDSVTTQHIASVIASDAGLAARVIGLANSAALSRSGGPCTDLRAAVTRVGHQNVRSAALAYALAQLRRADSLRHIRQDLAQLWQQSTLVAAIASGLALHSRAANPDEALLTGLLHNIGRVYILARADRSSAFFTTAEVRDVVMRDWHAQIGKAVAQNWGVPDRIVEAIGEQDTVDRLEATRRDLVDVLYVAVRAAECHEDVEALDVLLGDALAYQRLGLGDTGMHQILDEGAGTIAALRAALGE